MIVPPRTMQAVPCPTASCAAVAMQPAKIAIAKTVNLSSVFACKRAAPNQGTSTEIGANFPLRDSLEQVSTKGDVMRGMDERSGSRFSRKVIRFARPARLLTESSQTWAIPWSAEDIRRVDANAAIGVGDEQQALVMRRLRCAGCA